MKYLIQKVIYVKFHYVRSFNARAAQEGGFDPVKSCAIALHPLVQCFSDDPRPRADPDLSWGSPQGTGCVGHASSITDSCTDHYCSTISLSNCHCISNDHHHLLYSSVTQKVFLVLRTAIINPGATSSSKHFFFVVHTPWCQRRDKYCSLVPVMVDPQKHPSFGLATVPGDTVWQWLVMALCLLCWLLLY